MYIRARIGYRGGEHDWGLILDANKVQSGKAKAMGSYPVHPLDSLAE